MVDGVRVGWKGWSAISNKDGKLSRQAVDLPHACHPSPSLTTFAFTSSEVMRLLLDMDLYSGILTHWVCSLFFKENCWCSSPRLIVVFGGLFFWVVSLLAGDRPVSPQLRMVHHPPHCQLPTYYDNISILSKLFELLVSVSLGRSMKRSGVVWVF